MQKLLFLCLLLLALPAGAQDKRDSSLQSATEHLRQTHLKQLLDSMRLQELKADSSHEAKKRAQNLQNSLAYQTQRHPAKLDSIKKAVRGYAVAPFRDTLFLLYHAAGRASVQARAKQIERQIRELAEEPFFSPDSLLWVHHEPNYTLLYRNKVLMSFTDLDALWHIEHRKEVIAALAGKIRQAVQAHRQKYAWQRNLSEVTASFFLLTGLVLNVLLINFVFGRLHKRVFSLRRRYQGFKIGNYQLFDRRRQVIFLLFALRIGRLFSLFASIYWIVTYLFSIFPQTAGVSRAVWEYTLAPLKQAGKALLEYIPNFFFVLVIVVLMQYFLRFVGFFASEIERQKLIVKGFYAEWARPTFNLFKSLCYIFVFILIFPYLPGSSSPVFQTVSAFLGLLLSLGSSSAVSNMVAGIVITYMRSFKMGDRIKVGEVIGDVVEKNLLITRIKTMKDELVTIPNANLLAANTLNFSASNPFLIHTSVTIGYDAPWRTVHELLLRAASKTTGVIAEPKPFVLQTALNDFYVAYEINAYIYKAKRMLETYSELHQHIQDEFNLAGVEIMSPHYASLRDGNRSTVVPPDKWADNAPK